MILNLYKIFNSYIVNVSIKFWEIDFYYITDLYDIKRQNLFICKKKKKDSCCNKFLNNHKLEIIADGIPNITNSYNRFDFNS